MINILNLLVLFGLIMLTALGENLDTFLLAVIVGILYLILMQLEDITKCLK